MTHDNDDNSDDETLRPLKRTRESLDQISSCLSPFISLLDRYNHLVGGRKDQSTKYFDPRKIAEAKMAVALSMGTLRYMAAKLKGDKVDKNDPLRIELDKMRKVLVEFNSLHTNVNVEKETDLQKNQNDVKRNKRNHESMEPWKGSNSKDDTITITKKKKTKTKK